MLQALLATIGTLAIAASIAAKFLKPPAGQEGLSALQLRQVAHRAAVGRRRQRGIGAQR
jgi:hypothetical protein